MSQHPPETYLQHIQDALERVAAYTADGKQASLTSTLQQDAVLRNLEVIGEAVKRLPRGPRSGPQHAMEAHRRPA